MINIPTLGALSGIISVFGTLFIKYKEIQKDKEQFKEEHKYQITKETYQKIFDRKLLLYRDLDFIFLKYRKELQKIGFEYINTTPQTITEEDIVMKTYHEVVKSIEPNIFHLPLDIHSLFNKLAIAYSKEERNHREIFQGHEEMEDQLDIEFYKENQEEIKKLFSKLEDEIIKVKKKIEID